MPEYHFPIPGSNEEAKIILFVRKHWAAFIGQFILSFFMLVVPGTVLIIMYFFDYALTKGFLLHFIVLGLSIYYLIAINVAFVAWISFYYDIYIVANDTIIDVTQEGYWGRKISQVSLLRVQDVSSNIQGFLPTIFGYGDVLVETAGEQTQNFLLKSVPNPQEISAKILNLHHEAVARDEREHESGIGEGHLRPGGGWSGGQPPQSPPPNQGPQGAPAPQESQSQPPQTPYQELLQKDQSGQSQPVQGPPVETQQPITPNYPPQPSAPNQNQTEQGQITGNDLDQGGEIDLK